MQENNLYDKLNKILRKAIKSNTLLLEIYDAYNLSKIIFDLEPKSVEYSLVETINLDESINISHNFFESINPMYANQLLNIIMYEEIDNKPSVKFDKAKRLGNIIFNFSGIDEKGNVYIAYSNTLMDICTISHEFTHKFSTQHNEESLIKKQLCEITPITMEYLLEKYLLKNTSYNKNDIEYITRHRIELTYEGTFNIIFETILVELYIENGYINETILTEYINNLSKEDTKYNIIAAKKHEYLKQICENETFIFRKIQRYVVGTLLGIYISQLDNSIDVLNTLINILGNSNITQDRDIRLINRLNLPCIKDGNICINNSELEVLSNTLKQKVKKL